MRLALLRLRYSLPRYPRDWLMVTVGGILMLLCFITWNWIGSMQTSVPYQDKGITAQWVPATVKHWSQPINEMAKRYNLDPNLIAIIMTMESGGDPKAQSEADAKGLMQITPLTAQEIAKKHLKDPVDSYNLMDPRTNIEFGAAYLAYLRDVFGDATQGPSWNYTVELIAAGYNGGPGAAGNIYRGNGLHDTQTVVYSRDAFNMWRERNASDSPTFDRWKERGGQRLLDAAQVSQQ